MKIKKFNGFNEYGYLPYGMYNLTINEIEKIFSRNSSKRRKEIMEIYKIHLMKFKILDIILTIGLVEVS